jgi:hypothetical protein
MAAHEELKVLFWRTVFEEEIPEATSINTAHQLAALYKSYAKSLFKILDTFLTRCDDDPQYKERPEDPYDGIATQNERLRELVDAVIMHGETWYDVMLEVPFSRDVWDVCFCEKELALCFSGEAESDVLAYMQRGPSCGNSSCLYLREFELKTWQTLLERYFSNLVAVETEWLNEAIN